MTFISDNPERAGRITQVASQTGVIVDEFFIADKALAAKGKYVNSEFDKMMKKNGFDNAEAYLKRCAEQLDPAHKEEFLKMVETYKRDSGRINFACFIIAGFGVDFAWRKFNLPARMEFSEMWNIMKAAGAETKNSVVYMIKNPNGFKPQPPPNEKMFVIDELPAFVEEEQLGWLSRVRGRITVGAGGRFLRSIGCTVLAIGAGILLDELVEWSMKSHFVNAEVEVSMCRLSARYALDVFQAMDDLIGSLAVISELQEDLEVIHDPADRQRFEERIKKKQETAAASCGERLGKVGWEVTWETLHAKDTRENAYLKDDLSKEALIQKTKDAVAEEAKKDPAKKKG